MKALQFLSILVSVLLVCEGRIPPNQSKISFILKIETVCNVKIRKVQQHVSQFYSFDSLSLTSHELKGNKLNHKRLCVKDEG